MTGLLRREADRLFRDLVVNGLICSPLVPSQLRWRLLRLVGFPMARAKILSGVWFGGRQVAIGARTFVNHGCWFDAYAQVTIGAECRIGPQVSFVTSSHELGGSERRAGDTYGQPVTVEDGCWIGARAMILPGVTVGRGCIIAAGATVIEDCKPDGMYAGTPARRVRDLPVDVDTGA